MTYYERLVDCLTSMVPGDYHHMSILKYEERLLTGLNNSEAGKARKWWYHRQSDMVFCVEPRVYTFIKKEDKWNDYHAFSEIYFFIRVNHEFGIIDKARPTEQEISKAGEHQVSLVIDSKFMGEFIASGYNKGE